jgi:hypothetical protein
MIPRNQFYISQVNVRMQINFLRHFELQNQVDVINANVFAKFFNSPSVHRQIYQLN